MKKIKSVSRLLLFCIVLLFPLASIAQSITVSGVVQDISKTSLPGVSVYIEGTTYGTITDLDGNYVLKGVSKNSSIVFSYLGYKTATIKVNDQTTINITLVEDAELIDEVVVVGYGTMKKSD